MITFAHHITAKCDRPDAQEVESTISAFKPHV